MSNITRVGRQIRSFKSTPEFDGYSKVIITVSEDLAYEAGTDTGRTLSMDNPWGTQEMADNILAKIRGHQYQPYTATDAFLDPAAELGDGITANNVYGGIFSIQASFGRSYVATVSAPSDEELDHEYPYKSKQERTITRNKAQLTAQLAVQADRITAEVINRESAVKELRASLSIQADRITQEVSDRKSDTNTIRATITQQAGQIEAKVSKTGGSASSFGWVLDDSSWTLKSGGADVLKATKDGLEISGKIVAKSGKIGGFTIESNYLSYNNQTWGGTNSAGIYVGPSGIQLGKNFKVDAAGNLTANSGTFLGSVRAGNITYGGDSGYFSGYGLSSGTVSGGYGGAISGYSLSTYNMTGGINASLGYADFANGVFNGWNTAGYVSATYGYFSNIVMGGYTYRPMSTRVMGPSGDTPIYIYYLGRVW